MSAQLEKDVLEIWAFITGIAAIVGWGATALCGINIYFGDSLLLWGALVGVNAFFAAFNSVRFIRLFKESFQ